MTYSLHHIGIVLFYVCRRAEAHASVVLELLDALPKHVFIYVGTMSQSRAAWEQGYGRLRSGVRTEDVRLELLEILRRLQTCERPQSVQDVFVVLEPPLLRHLRLDRAEVRGAAATKAEIGLTCL